MLRIIKETFFNRPTLTVARELIGCTLCRKIGGKTIRLEINEVEAYDGFNDKASHAHKGITKRNDVMFGPAGMWYVYFTYGMHWMLNIVCGPKDYPAAVLIRGAGELNGPAKLTKYLKIDGGLNRSPANRKTGLWIEAQKYKHIEISKLPRVGVEYAGTWARKKYRFLKKRKKAYAGNAHARVAMT